MNRIEQLIVRQEWESRNDVPIFRIAVLCLLAIVLACMIVVAYHVQRPLMFLVTSFVVSLLTVPLFSLGRRHARRRLIRRSSPGNI